MHPRPPDEYLLRVMAWMFRVRDLLRPRERILAEINIQPGLRLLDYGCGPGGYAIPAARMVG